MIGVFSYAFLGPAVLAGAAVGALHHKNLGLSDADKARLTVELSETGKAAVGVMAHDDTASAHLRSPTQLGGTSERHELTDEILEAAAATNTAASDQHASRTRSGLKAETREGLVAALAMR